MTDTLSLFSAIEQLRTAENICVFSGAGLSRASGIPTFRDDTDGIWNDPKVAPFSLIKTCRARPQEAMAFWEARRSNLCAAKPNAAHQALAKLQQLRPGTTFITQNVDGLLTKAGAKDVIELHGSMERTRCLQSDDHKGVDPKTGACAVCQGVMFPAVVLFGEMLDPAIVRKAYVAIDRADVVVLVGTSAQVHPAATIIANAAASGSRVLVIDPNPPELPFVPKVTLPFAAELVLPELVKSI